MGFDIYGPTRHVRASNIDDADVPHYDLLAMPGEFGLKCPQIENLSRRFYEDTTLHFSNGSVIALREELVRLQDAYRRRREPELIAERCIRATEPAVRRRIIDRVIQEDVVYRALEDFRLLCDEAIAAESDVRCAGD